MLNNKKIFILNMNIIMNMLLIKHLFVLVMVYKIPRVSVFGYFFTVYISHTIL